MNRNCDFCENKSEIFAFKIERGAFKEYFFCSSCASSHSSPLINEQEDVVSVEKSIEKMKKENVSKRVSEMIDSDINNREDIPQNSINREKNKIKTLKDCFCCGTKKQEIIKYGTFSCLHCFDSFPDLESKFPEQFKKRYEQ